MQNGCERTVIGACTVGTGFYASATADTSRDVGFNMETVIADTDGMGGTYFHAFSTYKTVFVANRGRWLGGGYLFIRCVSFYKERTDEAGELGRHGF